MSGISLSITIPSYNRHDQLCARISELIAQMRPGVEVLVLDNASTPDLEQYVCERVEGARSAIRFVRNPANIGASANVCRCFELAQGDWVWLLGDDDTVYPGAVSSAVELSAAAGPSVILLKFKSTNGGNSSNSGDCDDLVALSDHCRDLQFYSNLLFISSSVYRRSVMLPRLGIGYHCCFSSAPHIAMLLDAVAAGGRVKLYPSELVRHGTAGADTSWNSTRVSAGFISLGDMESCSEFSKIAMPKIASHYIGGHRWLRHMMKMFLADTGRPPVFWCGYFLRFGNAIGGIKGFAITLLAWLFRLLLKIPGCRCFGNRLLGPCDTVSNLDRS